MENKSDKRYLEISVGSSSYIEVSKNRCSGILINNEKINERIFF